MKKKHGVEIKAKDRFTILREFEKQVQSAFKSKAEELRFKLLKNIEDPDEQQEAIHRLRQIVRYTMASNESLNLINMAQIAKNSSTRAYTGHSAEVRHIFDINNLNLTEFARAFGLYKNVAQKVTISSKNHDKASAKPDKKRKHKDAFPNSSGGKSEEKPQKSSNVVSAGAEQNQLYS
jgi:Domain of unknown function (DUF4217)